MTLTEMQTIAQETLADYIQMMPEKPFDEGDIIIEFAPQEKMAERAKALCAIYVPDKVLNENQMWELENIIAANALVGRDKSAILVCIYEDFTYEGLREILFHELTHIFCKKAEMDGEHFIDVYGSGHTPDENPENVFYDGQLNAGYVVWTEFIAQYYALRCNHRNGFTSERLTRELFELLDEVRTDNFLASKKTFAMVCSYMMACTDADDLMAEMNEPGFFFDDDKKGASAMAAFHNCLLLLRSNLEKDKPWKISEDFIAELGAKYITFIGMNSAYLGVTDIDIGQKGI